MQIDPSELADILNERSHLRKQVTELQAELGAKTEKSLYRTVGRFHQKFGHPVEHTPHVPEDAQVRFRLKLIAEEFIELLEACDIAQGITELRELVVKMIEGPVDVDLPEFVDAMGDLDWVVEGTRLVFGVLGEPVLREIERANMEKDPVYVATKDEHHRTPDPKAKPTKPAGWTPPNIAAVLERLGWKR